MPTEEEIKAAAEKAAAEEAARKAAEDEAKNFEAWLEKQPDNVKAMYAEHTGGLRSALEKERKANKENADKVKRLDELEKAETKRKQEQMSEAEKAAMKLSEAEKGKSKAEEALQEERTRSAITLEAAAQGFENPEDVFQLADMAELEFGDDGRPTKESVQAVVKKLEGRLPKAEAGVIPPPRIDATSKGGKLSKIVTKQEIIEKKRSGYQPL